MNDRGVSLQVNDALRERYGWIPNNFTVPRASSVYVHGTWSTLYTQVYHKHRSACPPFSALHMKLGAMAPDLSKCLAVAVKLPGDWDYPRRR